MMSRGLLYGRAEWPGVGSLLLSSTHLESFVGHDNQTWVKQNRSAQLREAGRLLEKEVRATNGCVGAVLSTTRSTEPSKFVSNQHPSPCMMAVF